jgi:NADH:ubiquinone oxidoreductase subunit 3 (subunit A)
MDTIGKTWVQFNFRYYFFALLFVLFDVEVVFFYPWAAAYQSLGLFALAEMVVFVGILMVGYIYAWRKGALEWK